MRLRIGPCGSCEDCVRQGRELEERSNFQGAIACYDQALMLSSQCWEAHFRIGLIKRGEGCDQDALEHLDFALKVNEKNNEILFEKAVTLIRLGKKEEACALFQDLVTAGSRTWGRRARESMDIYHCPGLPPRSSCEQGAGPQGPLIENIDFTQRVISAFQQDPNFTDFIQDGMGVNVLNKLRDLHLAQEPWFFYLGQTMDRKVPEELLKAKARDLPFDMINETLARQFEPLQLNQGYVLWAIRTWGAALQYPGVKHP